MFAVSLLLLAAAGCQARSEPAPPAATPNVTAPASPPAPAPNVPATRQVVTPNASPVGPDALVAAARADAAQRAGLAPTDISVVLVEAREWPDRSLGCPRPGIGYAQAITPGYLIVVVAGGQRYEYHTDHAEVVLCVR